ncbi:LptF/LptG family permease, partial [bacterium]|nr:LptF/LptG family permease [bacterium]
ILLFAAIGSFRDPISGVAVLVGVLLVHELGHFAAMKLFKYSDVQIFFIPMLGAAVTGSPTKHVQVNKPLVGSMLAPSGAPAETRGRRLEMLRATRQEVQRVRRASEFQQSVLRSKQARENAFLVEFHKKLAIPAACVVFVVIGLPMAVTASRSGRGVSLTLALAFYLVYYLFLVGGEQLADRGRLDPAVAMWAADAVLAAIGIPLLVRAAHENAWFQRTRSP